MGRRVPACIIQETQPVTREHIDSRIVLIERLVVVLKLDLMLSITFFFQAEDGIRDWSVTGVQTCALPISACPSAHRARGGLSAGADPTGQRIGGSHRLVARHQGCGGEVGIGGARAICRTQRSRYPCRGDLFSTAGGASDWHEVRYL